MYLSCNYLWCIQLSQNALPLTYRLRVSTSVVQSSTSFVPATLVVTGMLSLLCKDFVTLVPKLRSGVSVVMLMINMAQHQTVIQRAWET